MITWLSPYSYNAVSTDACQACERPMAPSQGPANHPDRRRPSRRDKPVPLGCGFDGLPKDGSCAERRRPAVGPPPVTKIEFDVLIDGQIEVWCN